MARIDLSIDGWGTVVGDTVVCRLGEGVVDALYEFHPQSETWTKVGMELLFDGIGVR